MNLSLVIAILYVVAAVGPAEAVNCYSCQGRPTKEKGGTCRASTAADTTTAACAGQCEKKVEDKTLFGMGIWYKRSCVDTCTASNGETGKSTYEVTCCSTDLCNGPGPAPTTTTTTTTTPAPTGTTAAGTTTTTAAGTTTPTAVTSPPPATTTTAVSSDQCYECSTFFFGSVCSDDTVKTDPSVDKVVCDPATTGRCSKIKTSIGFEWLDFDWSISRGCTTLCTENDDTVDLSLVTRIHCCNGNLCNKAIINIPARMVLLAAVSVSLFYYLI